MGGMNDDRPLAMTEREVAARLGLSVATLRAWRLKGKGPPFVRFGRAVRYIEQDVDRFVEASRASRPVHVEYPDDGNLQDGALEARNAVLD